jgi:uncharacterized membrane protein
MGNKSVVVKHLASVKEQQFHGSSNVAKQRIIFIDILRTYAIVMMLQGHTIDMVLDPIFRTDEYLLYEMWNYMRGITAPMFLFASGMVATVLLLREKVYLKKEMALHFSTGFPQLVQEFSTPRMRRIAWRGVLLVGIGYGLQLHPDLLQPASSNFIEAWKSALRVGILQCIGIGLLFLWLIIGCYDALVTILGGNLSRWTNMLWLIVLLMVLATTAFLVHPFVASFMELATEHLWIANYFTKQHGSTFPLIPWLGFMFWGATVGALMGALNQEKLPMLLSSWISPAICIAVGFSLTHFSSEIFKFLWEQTDWSMFQRQFLRNFAFYRLGNVFIMMGIASALALLWKSIPRQVLMIGQNTLFLYVAHCFILYGSPWYTGVGYQFQDRFSPWESAIAAGGMIILLVIMVQMLPYLQSCSSHIYKKLHS